MDSKSLHTASAFPSSVSDFAVGRIVDPELLARLGLHGILCHVERLADGTLVRSVAVALITAPKEEVVAAVERIRTEDGGFLKELNIIERFRIIEDRKDSLRIRLDLRYRFFILRFGFHVVAEVSIGEDGTMDLVSVGGKPKNLVIHFRLVPVEGDQTLFYCSLRYDVRSLGWLTDYFLRHHPEIELGVFSATAPVIVLTLKEHVERRFDNSCKERAS